MVALGLGLGPTYLRGASRWYGSTYAADGYQPAFIHDMNSGLISLPAYGADLCSATGTTTVTTEPGKLYELSATGSGTITIAVGTAAAGTNILAAATWATPRYFVTPVTTTHLTVTVTSGSLTDILVREVILGGVGANLGADTYTMTIQGGSATATESPTGTLNLTGDGTNQARGEKAITTVAGQRYRIICLNTTAAVQVRIGTTSGGTDIVPAMALSTSIVNEVAFTATTTTTYVRFHRATSGLGVISNINIVAFTPNVQLRSATFTEAYAFTASSTVERTYTNASGVIKNDLAANALRYTYNSTRAKWELRLEDAATNIGIWSENWTQASWIKTAGSINANVAVAPDGNTTADEFVASGTGGVTYLQLTLTDSTTYTVSVYVKRSAGSNFARVGAVSKAGNNHRAWFNLATGALGSTSGTVNHHSIVSVGDGWYRCCMSFPAETGATSPTAGVTPATADLVATCAINDAIYLWGNQIEAATFPSSYIPTTSGSVTRAAETARFSPLVEAILQRPSASIRVQALGRRPFATAPRYIGAGSGTGPLAKGSGGNTIIGSGNGSVTLTANLGSGNTNAAVGAAVAWNSGGRTVAANGGTVGTDTGVITSTPATWYLGRSSAGGTDTGDGEYYSVAIYPFRITDAGLPAVAAVPV